MSRIAVKMSIVAGHQGGAAPGSRKFQLEGLVAKKRDSLYESGRRGGAWVEVKLTLSGTTVQTGSFSLVELAPASPKKR